MTATVSPGPKIPLTSFRILSVDLLGSGTSMDTLSKTSCGTCAHDAAASAARRPGEGSGAGSGYLHRRRILAHIHVDHLLIRRHRKV
jgi:hypothetical protein